MKNKYLDRINKAKFNTVNETPYVNNQEVIHEPTREFKKKKKLKVLPQPAIDTRIYEVANLLPPMKEVRKLDDRLPPVHFFLVFIANYLMRDEFCGMGGENPIFERVHIISPSIKSDKSMQIYRQEGMAERFSLSDDNSNIENTVRGIVETQKEFDTDSKDPEEQPPNICIYIDDCSKYINKSNYIEHFFTVYRHYRISIILSLQNIKGMPPICRSQATGVWLSKVYDENERKKISEHFSESFKGEKQFYDIWDTACSEFYDFLYLNFSDYYPRAFKWGTHGLQEFHGLYPDEERRCNRGLEIDAENKDKTNIS